MQAGRKAGVEVGLAGRSLAERQKMATEILETTVTMRMSLPEAKALAQLLGSLPYQRHDTKVMADEFSDAQWERMLGVWRALDDHLQEKA